MRYIYAFLLLLFCTTHVNSQCPSINAAMVNSCGASEGINEFIVFTTSVAAPVSSYSLYYGSNTPATNSPSGTLFGSDARTKNGSGTITVGSSCTLNQVTSPATSIPAGSVVLFIPSNFNGSYDLAGLCSGGNVYVVYINITTGTSDWNAGGTLANSPSGNRYIQITYGSNQCTSLIRSFNNGWPVNDDGNIVFWNPPNNVSYQNNGCSIIAQTVTIAPSSPVAVCQGTTSTVMAFTTTGSPDKYSLTWDVAALAQGFTNVSLANLGTSTINIAVPAGAANGNYTASLVATNSTTSVSSTAQTITVTVVTPPPVDPITGSSNICVGGNTTLTNATTGGTWSSSNTSIVTINSSGSITGVAPGTATISYSVTTNSCGPVVKTFGVTVSSGPTVADISGTSNICIGANTVFTNTTVGGTWSSSNTSVATISSAGLVTPVSLGTATISYTVANSCGSVAKTFAITVAGPPTVSNIVGTANLCAGTNSNFTNATAGGTWASSNTSIATVSSTGTVTPIAIGNATISYTVNGSCGNTIKTLDIIVATVPTVTNIAGAANLCVGTNSNFTNTTSSGTWSSSNTAVATVSSTGTVTPVAIGNAIIRYAVTNSCGTTTKDLPITVTDKPVVADITGATTVNVNASITLSNTTASGVWSSSNTAIATINSSGQVTGIAAGTATINYTVTNGCGSTIKTFTVTVNAPLGNIFIPNAFTPNGDGNNDFFQVYGNNIQSLEMKIFNQWGEKIFETNSILGKWDGKCKGKMQPVGVYVYVAKIRLQNGTELKRKGSVNIVR